MKFCVIWEINIEAEGPQEAAQQAREIQLTAGMSATTFDVWAYNEDKMYRIDLVEEVDRLERDELFAIRDGLRILQCQPETPPTIQDIATIMLIFLESDVTILERMYRRLSS